MISQSWRDLSGYLTGRARPAARLIVAAGLCAGLLEAGLLILVVGAALAVAEGTSSVDVELPVLGSSELSIAVAISLAAAAAVSVLVVHAGVAYATSRITAGVLHEVRRQAIDAFANAAWARQASEREGALQETTSTLAIYSASLVGHFALFATGAAGIGMLLVAAVIVSPVTTVTVLVFGSLLFLAVQPIGRVTRRLGHAFTTENSALVESLSQWTGLAMELRVFGVEKAEADRLTSLSALTSSANARSGFATRFGSNLFKDLAMICLVLAVGGLYVVGTSDVAATGAVVLLIVRSLSYAQMTNTSLQGINVHTANLHSLKTRIGSLRDSALTYGKDAIDKIGVIRLEAVAYEYEPSRRALSGIDLAIRPGEAIGVIGPSGGGKSTLAHILLRLRTPTEGVVRIGNLDYREIDAQSWHKLVAVVPQEPQMFEASIAENIRFFRDGYSRGQIEAAAELAHLASDIRSLPEGFDTVLGPRGAGLSGGQKQRVAIARALLGSPQLLVLDEPTSALDTYSEQLIQRTVEGLKGAVTLVVVAHRLTTLACCDRVVAVDHGQILCVGSLDQAISSVPNWSRDDVFRRSD